MSHEAGAWAIGQAVIAVGYMVLGAWVLSLQPRTTRSRYLGLFSLSVGLWALVFLTRWTLGLWIGPATLAMLALDVVAIGVLLGLCLELARPALPDGPLPWMAAGSGGALAGIAVGWARHGQLLGQDLSGLAPYLLGEPSLLLAVHAGATNAVWTGAILLLALAAGAGGSRDRRIATQLGLVTAALYLNYGFGLGTVVDELARDSVTGSLAASSILLVIWVVVFLSICAVWLWNSLRAHPSVASVHVHVVWAILVAIAIGAVVEVLTTGQAFEPMATVGQVTGLLLLTYAVLRHDLAGLDAKVRWGISKGTVAGVFVAVFFVVSEAAQELFSGFAGSQWIGIGAAGVLLFALAPLQRLADQLAARAIPVPDSPVISASEERYATAVRMALADGKISRAEERELARLAEETGISPVRALELLEEAEASGRGPA